MAAMMGPIVVVVVHHHGDDDGHGDGIGRGTDDGRGGGDGGGGDNDGLVMGVVMAMMIAPPTLMAAASCAESLARHFEFTGFWFTSVL